MRKASGDRGREAEDLLTMFSLIQEERAARKEREKNTQREAPPTDSLFSVCCRGAEGLERGTKLYSARSARKNHNVQPAAREQKVSENGKMILRAKRMDKLSFSARCRGAEGLEKGKK